ncbi:ankyrin repeat domain-containing protein [Bordetella sp. 02P26C-1]|uniref:ankyrin repeat domain-containing protein n=1 Tax=Bordetella sp. 02P26C-1 TaxID=2683195 RepID=UPI00135445A2|nr:ankyrin repeat domain-containing protein [Bordetella sp. 02P26C-1]MVW80861.1 hypothetical protein [Bordetella sp. 02P26C-1]
MRPSLEALYPPSIRADYDMHYAPYGSDPTEALFGAIEKADAAEVYHLIHHLSPDLSALNDQGQNPLHLALKLRRDDIAFHLISHCGKMNHPALNEFDREGYTALMLAVENGHMPLVKMLIEKGATIHAGHDVNCSPQRLAQKNKTYTKASLLIESSGNIYTADALAKRRNIPGVTSQIIGLQAELYDACADLDIKTLYRLISEGLEPSQGLQALLFNHKAALSFAGANAVKVLVASGADLAVVWAHAIRTENVNMVRHLMSLDGKGADESLIRALKVGDTRALRVLLQVVNPSGALHHLAHTRQAQLLRLLLAQPGVSDLSTQALLMAVSSKDLGTARFLVAHGVPTQEAVMTSLRRGDSAVVKFLLDAGAETHSIICTLASGQPRAHGLAQLELLIGAGADPSQALYEMSKHEKNEHAVKLLLAAAIGSGRHIPAQDAERVGRVFDSASAAVAEASQFAHAASILNNNTDVDCAALLESYLFARDPRYTKSRAMSLDCEAAFAAQQGHDNAARLLRAIQADDWSVTRNYAMASAKNFGIAMSLQTALYQAITLRDHWRTRMLVALGANDAQAISVAISNNDVEALGFLLASGSSPATVARVCFRQSRPDLVNTLVDKNHLVPYDLYRSQFSDAQFKDKELVKNLANTLTTGGRELLAAISERNSPLARNLVYAGVDPHEALCTAVIESKYEAIIPLRELGADPSKSLIFALAAGQPTIAIHLIATGADYDAAQEFAATRPNARELTQALGSLQARKQ